MKIRLATHRTGNLPRIHGEWFARCLWTGFAAFGIGLLLGVLGAS